MDIPNTKYKVQQEHNVIEKTKVLICKVGKLLIFKKNLP